MNAPKRITVEKKNTCINDVLDNGIPIHIAVIKHGIPAIVINKWIDAINEAETGVAHAPIAGNVQNSPEMKSTTVSKPVTEFAPESAPESDPESDPESVPESAPEISKPDSTKVHDSPIASSTEILADTAESSGVKKSLKRRTKKPLFILILSVVCIGLYFGIQYSDEVKTYFGISDFNEDSNGVANEPEATLNPLLRTPITLEVAKRLGIKTAFVNIEDTNEEWFDPAKDDIYLKVTSNKFPPKIHVLLPIALAAGTQGIGTSYYQLPFEVSSGDILSFELLIRDGLQDDDTALLFRSFESHEFCIIQGLRVHEPSEEFLKVLQRTEADVLSEVTEEQKFTGKLLIQRLNRNALKEVGVASFPVTDEMPSKEADAFALSLADGEKVRMTIFLYGPPNLLPSGHEER